MAEDQPESEEVRLAFRIGYLGTAFSGSQVQPDKRTVEGEIVAACMRAGLITDKRSSRLMLSGRTDRGVHARCQILSFSTHYPDRAVRALNGQLPPDIWVIGWTLVPDGFSPRYDVISRTYRYYYPQGPSDVELMRQAADLISGHHDFTCFARLEPGKNPLITVESIRVDQEDDSCWLTITARSFLWHMVRCIACSAFRVSEGELSLDDILTLLSGTCKNKAKPAPPEGLILWDVKTDLSWNPIPVLDTKMRTIRDVASHHRLMYRVSSLLVE